MAVQIRYTIELPVPDGEPDEMRDHELTLDCYLNQPVPDIGWAGSLEDYNVVAIEPPYTGPVEHVEKAIEDHWARIEERILPM